MPESVLRGSVLLGNGLLGSDLPGSSLPGTCLPWSGLLGRKCQDKYETAFNVSTTVPGTFMNKISTIDCGDLQNVSSNGKLGMLES